MFYVLIYQSIKPKNLDMDTPLKIALCMKLWIVNSSQFLHKIDPVNIFSISTNILNPSRLFVYSQIFWRQTLLILFMSCLVNFLSFRWALKFRQTLNINWSCALLWTLNFWCSHQSLKQSSKNNFVSMPGMK